MSEEETQWLTDHSVIRLVIDPGFAPFEWLDEEGRISIAADYMAFLEQLLGIHFDVLLTQTWGQSQ